MSEILLRRIALIAAPMFLAACQTTPYESRPSPSLPPTVPGQATPTPSQPPQPTAPVQEAPVTPWPFTPPAGPRLSAADLLPGGITDRPGWARDIDAALDHLEVPRSAENLCAAMAVIEQESTWQADPVVAGLPRIVRNEIDSRAERYGIPKIVVSAALEKSSPDGRSYARRIAALRTEKQMNTLFEDMLSELPLGKTLLSGFNPIRTGGPMQVSIAFAEDHLRQRPFPYARTGSVRHEVFTRRGGLYFGIANLLDYPADYPHPRYRFADFNAGQYSSRNAAFQSAITRVSGRKLAPDGDLLRYQGKSPSNEASSTEAALRAIAGHLHLSARQIRSDLTREKSADFSHTRLYDRLWQLAERKAGRTLPRQQMPDILLKSPKIQRKLTTAWFAKRVEWRYDRCLARER
ncbi:DUF1615 domain-containing protein [Denitromonas halophila]|uniref:DUF1615 domain-containing protein n=1 Tax=Denitromonas halophila TaxID=1629404 RepID=A0A557QJM9_9RHOO|nr:DUF1615 domain-containing protein [Denitromonas halophila]TVO53115.1 DUF1615 domain-containing protein [Denitromonas halophila]